MNRFIFILILIGGGWYLFQKKNAPKPVAEAPIEIPPQPPILSQAPPPVMNSMEFTRVRLSTKDSDPQVRWAAMELLYKVGDPQALTILEEALRIDTDPDVRMRALEVIKTIRNPRVPDHLMKALLDTEKSIRLSALNALADIGEPSAIPAVVQSLRDTDADVRMTALQSIGRIQAKLVRDHREAQEKAKAEWEEAVRKAKEARGEAEAAKLGTRGELLDMTKKALKGE